MLNAELQTTPELAAGKRQRLGRMVHRLGLLPLLARGRALLAESDVRILAYHRVLDVAEDAHGHTGFEFDLDLVSASVDQFRQQMSFLRDNFQPLRFSDWIEAQVSGRPLPGNAILVTFDDGYDDNYHYAFPILRELGMPATFFVATGHIDSGLPYVYDWLVHMLLCTPAKHLDASELGINTPIKLPRGRAARRALGADVLGKLKSSTEVQERAFLTRLANEWGMPANQPHPQCQPMTWSQLREMHATGMEVASHAVSHRILARLPDADLAAELNGSLGTLRRELDDSVTPVLAYPVGGPMEFSERVIELAREAGYQMGCSYISGSNPVARAQPFELRRIPIERYMDIGWFAAAVTIPSVFSYSHTYLHR